MVSKASRLLAKGEKITFDTETGTVEYIIKPMKNKELLEIVDLAEKKQNSKMLFTLLKCTLIKDDPEIKDEDIENMPTPFVMKLLNLITKVNGLEGMLDFQQGGSGTHQETSSPASKSGLIEELRQRVQGAKI